MICPSESATWTARDAAIVLSNGMRNVVLWVEGGQLRAQKAHGTAGLAAVSLGAAVHNASGRTEALVGVSQLRPRLPIAADAFQKLVQGCALLWDLNWGRC